jgi:DNA-binding XRE family transcriptional regulator
MLNANKLKGKIVEEGTTQEELASKIGMTLQALNKKLNGRSKFDIDEAHRIIEVLRIENPTEIFFATNVPK